MHSEQAVVVRADAPRHSVKRVPEKSREQGGVEEAGT